MDKFQVVFETAIYHTVFVDAHDAEEAQNKAFDLIPDSVYMPNGFEVNESWFIDSVVVVDDDF